MNILSSIIKAIPMIAFITSCNAQIKNEKVISVKIDGNCEMCKKTIDKAGSINRMSKLDWNKDSKLAVLHFDSSKISTNEVLKKVALAGYDNEKYLAPDEIYSQLPDCCKYERARKKTAVKEKKLLSLGQVDNRIAADVKLKEVVGAYFGIKDALVSSNIKEVSVKANEFKSILSKVDNSNLKKDQQAVWIDKSKGLIELSEDIIKTSSIEKQRQSFVLLSQKMYSIAKVSSFGEVIYYQHCPMYDNGKGANWLSKEEAVKNPYYGSKMLSCGKTIEVIK